MKFKYILSIFLTIAIFSLVKSTVSDKIMSNVNTEKQLTPGLNGSPKPQQPLQKQFSTDFQPVKNSEVKVKETLQQKWARLFGVDKTALDCFNPHIKIDYTDRAPETIEEEKMRKSLSRAPSKQRDIYTDIEMGFGTSSYMFDYLDDTLRSSILNEFQVIVQNAKKIELKDLTYEDPYHLATILNGTPKKKSDNKEEENKLLLEKLTKILPTFDVGVWSESLDAYILNDVIKQWKWNVPSGKDEARTLIDMFDFNGDGRLSQREFVLASFTVNKNIIGKTDCLNCYSKIASDLIDPMFYFFDCDGDGKVSAEEIWNGLLLLKNNANSNFFNCKIDNAYYKTSAINDFVLKASTIKGVLTIEEFRQGILLGFWNRHLGNNSIEKLDSLTRKQERWPSNKDIACEKLEKKLSEEKANSKQPKK